jgi:SAM-dependent methyltransferase
VPTVQLANVSGGSLDSSLQAINFFAMEEVSVSESGAISAPRASSSQSRRRRSIWSLLLPVSTALALALLASDFSESPRLQREPRSRRSVQRASSQVLTRTSLDSLRATLRQCLRSFGSAPLVYPIINAPIIKNVLSTLPISRSLYGSKWDRKHPFDRIYGTDTSGFLTGDDIATGHPAEEHGSPYAGVQPSVLRRVLATLPNLDRCTFIDLGCGKGRPMLIASEFPFHDIVGVELSPQLATAAQRNAGIMARKHPERTPIRVDVGDATAYPIPDGDVVLFIYNSFDHELMRKVVANVDSAIAANGNRSIYVVFCNPATGDCFDACPSLTRRFARTLAYEPHERDYAEDAEDAVVIWQGGNAPASTEVADAKIVIVKERWRAALSA